MTFELKAGEEIEFDYVNWKGEFGKRRVLVYHILWGSNKYHPEEQWLLVAEDLDKDALRTFAMKDMKNVKRA